MKISNLSTTNTIQGNYIGTNTEGTAALGNSSDGITISGPGNTVGGTAAGARNVISGNAGRGITISGSGASGNVVEGNFIGTDVSGEANVHNNSDGIYISTPNNRVGGTTTAARNIIAYNGTTASADGVEISGSTAQGNLLQGNRIGVNVSGTAAGNFANGVRINAAQKNTIGGATSAERNLIVNNGWAFPYYNGVEIIGTNAKENVVRGNVISHNGLHGVHVNGGSATLNIVAGNLIGTDETGTAGRGNGGEGVYLDGAPSNTVGGTAAGDGNVVSDNGRGVTIYGAAATGNLVRGNFIGTDITGAITDPDATPGSGDELGNIGDGVFISSAPGNTIGGTAAGARNVISGNGAVGVEIFDAASGNYVVGNFIGTNLAGTAALGNAADGVFINNARSNVIGGTTTSARNVISANQNSGVNISGNGATNNVIQGNNIGTDANGTVDLHNGYDGVRVGAFSSSTSVGGTAASAGNIIAFNLGDGVMVDRSIYNGILGNSIFKNAGTAAESSGLGIDLVTADVETTIGPNPNDDDDVDTGTNNYQNFPVLTSATSGSSSTNIQGTFNSTPSTSNFRIEFFANPTCDPSGYGEGKQYLGFSTVNTNASGDATINVTFPTALPAGWSITATATDPSNNTSEFSQCQPPPARPSGDVNGDGHVSMVDAMLIAQYVAGLIGPGALDLSAADVNCSGNVSMVDAMLIAQYVAGLIPELTCTF